MESIAMKKVMIYNIVLMTMTSLHHIYGAWRYDTPWRLHVLMISVPVILAVGLLYRFTRKENSSRILYWIFWILTLVPSILLIGLFEGVYNHILKNILYFLGAGRSVLDNLYEPGVYELPNDFLFEFTGILQGLVVLPLMIYFVRLTRSQYVCRIS